MMKSQLAGLMKQAQAMQENLKKAHQEKMGKLTGGMQLPGGMKFPF